MNKVIKHPRSDRGTLARLDRLAADIGSDRARAVASLSYAVGNLDALCRLCDVPELRAMADEYRDALNALANLDPCRLDDELSDRLARMELKLRGSLRVLDKYRAPDALSRTAPASQETSS